MIHDFCANFAATFVTGEITQHSVDSVESGLSTIFINSLQKTFGNHKKPTYKGGRSDKKELWFGQRVGLLDSITTMHVKSLIIQKLTVINVI